MWMVLLTKSAQWHCWQGEVSFKCSPGSCASRRSALLACSLCSTPLGNSLRCARRGYAKWARGPSQCAKPPAHSNLVPWLDIVGKMLTGQTISECILENLGCPGLSIVHCFRLALQGQASIGIAICHACFESSCQCDSLSVGNYLGDTRLCKLWYCWLLCKSWQDKSGPSSAGWGLSTAPFLCGPD